MVDIQKLQTEIVERLKPLNPSRIILFGSYADGTADEDSDVDLFLIHDTKGPSIQYRVNAMMRLRDLIRKYHIGFDILSASEEFLESRSDSFYREDILQNGKVLYAQ